VSATLAQLQYITLLATAAGVDVPNVGTFEEASDVIDGFLKGIELKDPTRKAIFAMLRDSGKTKEDMYAAVGIDSLAVMSTASEYDGQRCIRWIKGETVEVRRGDQVNQEIKPMTFRPLRRPAPLTREQRIPADAIPGVDADPTTGKPLEFKTPATTPPILMPDAANVDDAEAQSAIDTLVEALSNIGQVVDASTCRAERMGPGLLAGTIAYQVSGAGITPRVVLVYPDGARWEDFQRRGDPATLAWTQTQAEFLRAPF
jgi:hypothetical protein